MNTVRGSSNTAGKEVDMSRFESLAARRRANRITRQAVKERMACSYSWVRWLEAGAYDGPTVGEWQARYENALNELVEERKERKR